MMMLILNIYLIKLHDSHPHPSVLLELTEASNLPLFFLYNIVLSLL